MSRMLIYMIPFVLLLIPLGITIKNHKDSKILKVVEQNIKRIKIDLAVYHRMDFSNGICFVRFKISFLLVGWSKI